MIKFFRKIRQRLLQKNKLSAYTFYALGEILLVVVGILLALQINNWNENRKLRKVETEILTNIREGLHTDVKGLIPKLILECEKRIQLTDALLEAVNTNEEISDSLRKNYVMMGRYGDFTPVMTPYKILESKGLDIIQNEELKISILNLFNVDYELLHSRFINDALNKRDIYRPMLRKHFNFYPPEVEYRYLPVDYQAMLKDRDFVNTITIMNINNKGIVRLLKELITKVNSIIVEIDQELEQL